MLLLLIHTKAIPRQFLGLGGGGRIQGICFKGALTSSGTQLPTNVLAFLSRRVLGEGTLLIDEKRKELPYADIANAVMKCYEVS